LFVGGFVVGMAMGRRGGRCLQGAGVEG
jgi:hypothetical protein